MENLLNFPQSTFVNKVVPKNAFYGRSAQKTWLKDLLTREFESITWLYKLAPYTLNVADGQKVHEINVFHCKMKQDHYSIDAFYGLDELIQQYTLYIIEHDTHVDLLMHFKEKYQIHGEERLRLGKTEILPDADLSTVRLALAEQNLDAVYSGVLAQVSQLNISNKRSYEAAAEQRKELKLLKDKLVALTKKLSSEKQYNRQIAINHELKEVKKKIVQLEKE